ncbi:MAG: class A beta-lactamase [Bryobacterales bacterium]|nr:class A beta-lactamase [Bryobacterales bacterium]
MGFPSDATHRRDWLRTAGAALCFTATAAVRLRADETFTKQLESFVQPLGAELGFASLHLESGERFAIRGGERFPMASVYKLPIALTVLDLVDRGELTLVKTVRILPSGLRIGLGTVTLAKLVGTEGYDFTIRQLLERTLEESDNATSDALLRLVGAPAVTARMAALGLEAIRVDRQESELLLDFVGVPSAEPAEGWTPAELRARYDAATPSQRTAALAAFLSDPRDTATPEAMLALLGRIHAGEALSAISTKRLLGHMSACKTGNRRLRGELPESVDFAHRTGTSDTTDGITGVTNDVGILTLPEGKGTLLLAAFLRRARGAMPEREAALARIGRLIFERYTND